MATENLTGDEQQKVVEQPLCSAGLTTGLRNHLMLLSVLNSFLLISAILGNVLILIAFHKESSLHPPSKLLLPSLGTTDLCVGLISEPVIIAFWVSVVKRILEYLSLRLSGTFHNWIYPGWCVSVDIVGPEIQTSCNFKVHLGDRCFPLGCVHCLFSNLTVWLHT